MPTFEYFALVLKNKNMRYLPDSIIYKFTVVEGEGGSDYESVVGKYYYVNRLIEDPKNASKKSDLNYSYELIMKDALMILFIMILILEMHILEHLLMSVISRN